jgi:hypothetical protein
MKPFLFLLCYLKFRKFSENELSFGVKCSAFLEFKSLKWAPFLRVKEILKNNQFLIIQMLQYALSAHSNVCLLFIQLLNCLILSRVLHYVHKNNTLLKVFEFLAAFCNKVNKMSGRCKTFNGYYKGLILFETANL